MSEVQRPPMPPTASLPAAPTARRRHRTGPAGAPGWRRLADAAGILVLGLLLAAAVLGAVPVRNGRVQDCGAPLAFLWHGRVDVYPDASGSVPGPDGRPLQLTEEELADAFGHRCSQRVGSRLVPVAVTAGAALVLGVIALVGGAVDLWARWEPAAASTPDPPGPAGAPPERAGG